MYFFYIAYYFCFLIYFANLYHSIGKLRPLAIGINIERYWFILAIALLSCWCFIICFAGCLAAHPIRSIHSFDSLLFLASLSLSKISLRIICNASLVVMNFLKCFLSYKYLLCQFWRVVLHSERVVLRGERVVLQGTLIRLDFMF